MSTIPVSVPASSVPVPTSVQVPASTLNVDVNTVISELEALGYTVTAPGQTPPSSGGSTGTGSGTGSTGGTTPPPAGSVGFGQAPMAAPVTSHKTYSASDLVFEDKFSGSKLDLAKWWPRIGAQGSVWDNFGKLACPYSGGNTPLGQNGQNEGQVGDPSQIVVNNGLSMSVKPNPGTPPFNAAPYNEYLAIGAEMTTYNVAGNDCTGSTAKLTLPNTGWYVQILAKLPDMQHGIMGNIWFLEPNGGAPEIDVVQPCFGVQVGASGEAVNEYPFGIGYLNGANGGNQAIPGVGVDVTQEFHTYGVEWIPNKSLTVYFDGKQVYGKTSAEVGGAGLVPGNYEIIMEAAVWIPGLGFTTPYNGGSGTYEVAQIQAFRA